MLFLNQPAPPSGRNLPQISSFFTIDSKTDTSRSSFCCKRLASCAQRRVTETHNCTLPEQISSGGSFYLEYVCQSPLRLQDVTACSVSKLLLCVVMSAKGGVGLKSIQPFLKGTDSG